MTAELTVLALAAILQTAQIIIAGVSASKDVGQEWLAGPRDSKPDFSQRTARLRRAVDNHFQGLIFFTIGVVLIVSSNQSSGFTALCAWIYLLARIVYVPAYVLGWVPGRTIIWGVGFAATMLMILASLV
ncbi:MAPEG family protein [Paracoccus sp. TK19116]|uniref:MAPEG family protein n=1 Tax=Paracoccus albicereus TaxID=2922394 RepID=A0ABT1MPU0_9RHOB|nr:MAPEG family protein [Paracoccus albicereus]MCQ0970307.1 MAPEG family protein [Paracoccus albicereus]